MWTSDIPPHAGGAPTYLTCGEGDAFLCAIRDEHSRRVLGWSIADHMRTELVEQAVDAAALTRGQRVRGTILHSDYAEDFVKPRNLGVACVGGVG